MGISRQYLYGLILKIQAQIQDVQLSSRPLWLSFYIYYPLLIPTKEALPLLYLPS